MTTPSVLLLADQKLDESRCLAFRWGGQLSRAAVGAGEQRLPDHGFLPENLARGRSGLPRRLSLGGRSYICTSRVRAGGSSAGGGVASERVSGACGRLCAG